MDFLSNSDRLVIIGIGNSNLGDDGIGVFIINEIKKRINTNYVLNGGTLPENIIHKLRKLKPTHILLIDAADFNEAPGSYIIANSDDIIGKAITTHQLPLSLLMQYLESEYSAKTRLLCIQIKSKGPGEPISPKILETANNLINILVSSLIKR